MADSKLNELSLITTPTMNSPLYTVESSSDKRMLVKDISQVIGDENIAPAYDATETYSEGDYCMYEGKLYQCNTDISTAEAFDSTKWDEVKVTELSGGGGASVVQLTAAQYDALSMTEKMNGSIYKLTDKAVMYCLDEEYHALKELTSAQYEALSVAEQNNGTLYIQTDAETTGSDIPVSSSSSETIAEAIGDIQTDIDSIPTFDTEFLTATTGTTTPYTGYYYADIQKTKSGTIVSALVYDTTSNRLAFCQALDSTTIRVWSPVASTTIKVRVLLMN